MYAMHASFHSGIHTTPGALAFHCNMVMNIPMMSDLTLVQQIRQQLIDQHLIESNRLFFLQTLEYKPNKLAPCAAVP
jgi:hypothetical protein